MRMHMRACSMTVCVQKKCGGDPQTLVSSEFAAMLDLVILPELVKPYKAAGEAAFKQACVNIAAQIGVHWTEVHYPFFLSTDNDHKHPWARKLLLKPRVTAHKLAELEGEALQFVATCTDGMTNSMLAEAAAAEQPAAQRIRHNACVAEHGCTPWQRWWRREADKPDKPFLRTVAPEQWMPLVSKTPDIHQVVEHMVGDIKKDVKRRMHFGLYIDEQLLAKTYQEYISGAVRRFGNSEWGKENIRGSCKKQPLLCRILEEDEGVPVLLVHTCGAAHGSAGSCAFHIHHDIGTAGGWPAGDFK